MSSATAVRRTMPRTSTVELTARFHRSFRSIRSTTGERTATLKIETKISRSTWPTEASAQARATATPTRRIVRIEMKTASSRLLVPSAAGEEPEALIPLFIPTAPDGDPAYGRARRGLAQGVATAVLGDVDEDLPHLGQFGPQAPIEPGHLPGQL